MNADTRIMDTNAADVPVARLARRLQNRFTFPAHLNPEELAAAFCEEFDLTVPVTPADAFHVLEVLEIPVNPPGAPQRLPDQMNGYKIGDIRTGTWVILLNRKRAAPRQVQTLFHELYEILRDYFHLWGGAFPDGWDQSHYRPEQYARWFAAAVALPRQYVLAFVAAYGLDVELLRAESHCSRHLAARRLRELLLDTPLVAVECAVPKYLLKRNPPAFRCIESVRSAEFSVAMDAHGGRKYHLPRKREVWNAGALVEMVVETGRLVLVERVSGYDLFGMRDVCALGVPRYRKNRLSSVALYAVPAELRYLFDGVVERMDALIVDEHVHLVGALQHRAPRKPRKPLATDREERLTRATGETITVRFWRRPRARQPEQAPPEQLSLVIEQAIPVVQEPTRQMRWAMDEVDVGEELCVPV